MIKYVVEYAEELDERLEIITDYMAFHGRSDASIERYIDEVYAACDAFGTFPNRGAPHDNVMPGLKVTHYQGGTILAFVVDDELRVVRSLAFSTQARIGNPSTGTLQITNTRERH